MKRYYVTENNSGGFTVCLGVLSDAQPHSVYIDAENAPDAISQFERHFGVCWEYENSYEGNSCNCCGRRFSLYTPDESEEDCGIMSIWHDARPYFRKESVALKGCPVPERG